ncbi:MerR family transcriptional regulator [Neobacillus kokaensis]|uniref:MerR family transcriptional regulator n=1 Tax=Neobacillus kokaensis TaxID=2759023 RepID=A0ABQ3NAR5_9BACI|nr:MerR family transcriptional regulator [Neobacillus kokaensis]GHI00182.1 MerR family transcriptional regulator [Neobacillus kokaensis]
MEYTVQKLASLAGVSSRTLRYYDEIGLLKPARVTSSGYRIYGQAEVDCLQQILFYRELGLGLEDIKEIITDPAFNAQKALTEHRKKLLEKREQLNQLIANVEKTIAHSEGRTEMSDKEKFEGFKKKTIDENEKNFGEEIREKYGSDTVDLSNAKFLKMTQKQYEEVTALAEQVTKTLTEAMKTADPAGELGQKAAGLHKKWLTYYWNEYSKEAHAGLARMYVEDERFKSYYDKGQLGTAEFLRDAILIYTGFKQ